MLWATGEGDMEKGSHSILTAFLGWASAVKWRESAGRRKGGSGRQGFATLQRATGLPGRTSLRT